MISLPLSESADLYESILLALASLAPGPKGALKPLLRLRGMNLLCLYNVEKSLSRKKGRLSMN